MGKSSFDTLLQKYDYFIPESFIAQNPVFPRDSAKLLVYDRKSKKTFLDTFKNLIKYLPQGSVLVFNKTKVIPARIIALKPTGGRVSLLYLRTEGNFLVFLANVRIENEVTLNAGTYTFTVREKKGNEYFTTPSFQVGDVFAVLSEIGITPLPPYIKHTTLTEKKLRKEYQTVFAKSSGSVAAPTASLHFTKNLMKQIVESGHRIYFVTLHVNLGTFAKLTKENIQNEKLHDEYYEIDKKTLDALNFAKTNNQPIIAVGTTVVRTLESASNKNGDLATLSGTTDLFITENYPLRFVNHVITNFHVPKSSLLMLVASFTKRGKLFKLYKIAQENNFRFFSFGDGMFIK